MKTIWKILISSLFLIVIGLFWVNLVYAGFHTDPIIPCGVGGSPECTICDLWVLASNIINFISFNLAVPVAVLLFIVAGVFFLISGGSEDKIKRAKTIFTNTVIGLTIIFCSWLFIDTLIKTLVPSDVSLRTQEGKIIWAWNVFPDCGPSSVPTPAPAPSLPTPPSIDPPIMTQ